MTAARLGGDLALLESPPPLETPFERVGVFEPHVAVDPDDQRRLAVVAVHPSEVPPRGVTRNVWCWTTADRGETWRRERIVQAAFDGEGVADPLIGYGPDRALIAVNMVHPKALVDDYKTKQAGFTRKTAPGIDQVMRSLREAETRQPWGPTGVCVSRSDDHGRTWSSLLIPGSNRADKTALAIDSGPSSPHRSNVYVAWTAGDQLHLARSVDGGRSMLPPITIGGRNGHTNAQLAVSHDGTLHVVWHVALWKRPDIDDPRAATSIFYSKSHDGGVTFTPTRVIAEHAALDADGGLDRMGIISLGLASDGAMLAAWSEAERRPSQPGGQVRNTVKWIHTRDGERWSAPAPLGSPEPEVSQGLPAIAATASGWHVLIYEASRETTRVLIYSATRGELDLRPSRVLAQRRIASEDIYLSGTYQLRKAKDIAIVGDYVGLAGADRTLAAAIVFPETDDWRSTNALYAAVLHEEI